MPKRLILFFLSGCAVVSLAMAGGHTRTNATAARLVQVQRGDVHQVVAVVGSLTYAQASYVYAASAGVVDRICVEPGQRVEEGALLVCLDSHGRDQAVSSIYENLPVYAANTDDEPEQNWLTAATATVRSPKTCTVRQILVDEGMPVSAGTPVIRTSSHQQEIVCSVSASDAKRIRTGMWAWLSNAEEPLGTAVVQTVGDEWTEPSTGQVLTTIVLRPEQHIHLPEGVLIDADVYLAGSDDVCSLPVEAVTERETVWWVHEGRCTEIPAQIVLCDEMRAWVDLPEGLTVAVGEFEEGQWITEAKQ